MKNLKDKAEKYSGITLIALVITIIVLLILAGVSLSMVLNQDGIFSRAENARTRQEIAQLKEALEMAKNPVLIDGVGKIDKDQYFEEIQKQSLINDKTKDVVDNGDGTYDVTTKPGHVFLIELLPTKENPRDIKVDYIGEVGKILPIIRKLEVSATSTSITGKATISRLGSGTAKYYYKVATEGDNAYKEITNINHETGATQESNIVAGTKYIIKVVAKNDVGEAEKTEEITATKIFVETIILNKSEETLILGKTETVTLVATVLPENATNKNLIWESNNNNVAMVSNTGVITVKTVGTTTITVKATDGSNKSAICEVTIKDLTAANIVGEKQEETITVKDENGNKFMVPGGFRVLPHGTENADIAKVEYNYDEEHKPCVQDGIVIADDEDNQFVWIPVGNIKNKDNTTTTITLGRYTFDTNDGTPTLEQDATNYSQIITVNGAGGKYYQELTREQVSQLSPWAARNEAASNLGDFVNKTQANKGYYLGRYEASQGGDGKVDSQADKSSWVDIKQSDAASSARRMYANNYVESDLINSYSWDTAIVFIQKYSTGNSNYANKTGESISSKQNTGKSGDKVCNVHDMAGNCREWSTEHSTFTEKGYYYWCVFRGGNYGSSDVRPSWRGYATHGTYIVAYLTSFRVVLYVN